MGEFRLSSIEDALKDFKDGQFVIVVDDEDRENEGDLIIAAEKITPEKVNFMLKNARGVLCAPITLSRCEELDLPHQVSDNTSMLGTPFTVTIDKLEDAPPACQHTIVLPPSKHSPTQRLHHRHSVAPDISIRSTHRTTACSAAADTPRLPSTSAAWQVSIRQAHSWR